MTLAGLDLGLSCSAACLVDGRVSVVPNAEGSDVTPGVVWLDKKGQVWVGRRARARMDNDPKNVTADFWRNIGNRIVYEFPAAGVHMEGEALTAEMIKALAAGVAQRMGPPEKTAICVPVDADVRFEEGMRAAAEMASLTDPHFIPRPIAAVCAYIKDRPMTALNWLVYHLDAAGFNCTVLHSGPSGVRVLGYDSDSQLGMHWLDEMIVDQLFIPAVNRTYSLADFQIDNPRWHKSKLKLLQAAEMARKALQVYESYPVAIEALCSDEHGTPLPFDYELFRSEVEPLITPIVARSMTLCQLVLRDVGLQSTDIHHMIMVGEGSTDPHVLAQIADPVYGLGVLPENEVDPLTCAAQGAVWWLHQGFPDVSRDDLPAPSQRAATPVETTPPPEPPVTPPTSEPPTTPPPVTPRPPARAATPARPPNPDSGLALILKNGAPLGWLVEPETSQPAYGSLELRTSMDLHAMHPDEVIEYQMVHAGKVLALFNLYGAWLPEDLPAGNAVQLSIELDAGKVTSSQMYISALDLQFDDVLEYGAPVGEAYTGKLPDWASPVPTQVVQSEPPVVPKQDRSITWSSQPSPGMSAVEVNCKIHYEPEDGWNDWTVELKNLDTGWVSPPAVVQPDGSFKALVLIRQGATDRIQINPIGWHGQTLPVAVPEILCSSTGDSAG